MVKHLQKLFALVLVCCAFLGSSGQAWGQVLKEHFNYAPGSLLISNGWSAHSAGGTNSIAVTPEGTSLFYKDYSGSSLGNAVTLTTSGEDVNKTFTAYTSGSVYVGFLINVSSASAGDYFLNFGPSVIGTTFTGKVYAKSSGEGFQLGVSKGTTPAAVYGETVYEFNKTHLVVLKYTFITGSSNDNVQLFVNPVTKNGEPTTATVTAAIGGTDAANIGSVALRQGSSTSAAELTVDGIVVTNTWNELIGAAPLLIENFSYPSNSKLTDTQKWSSHSSGGTNPISTTTEGSSLVYNGYAASGVGEAIILKTSGEDVNRIFETVSGGSLYASILMNASTATTTGDYFFHIGQNPLSSHYGRVYIKASGSGFLLGVSKASSPAPVYGSTVYEFNKTHLVVLKYTFNIGSGTDDVAEIFVNPVLSSGQPATATVVSTAGGTDAPSLGSVVLRQGSSSSAANVVVDGIVVGTEWEALRGIPDEIAPVLASLTPANGATNVKTTTQNLSIVFSENVVKGTGNITLVDAANADNNQVFDVTSSTVKVSGATVTIPVTLAPNTNYSVQISGTAFTDRAGNTFAGIADNTTWAFSTPEFATPVLSVNKTTVNLAYVKEGTATLPTTYTLSGVDVREPVTVTAASPFVVSLDGITFESSVSVPAAAVLTGTTIYVNLTATTVGDYSGTITNTVAEGDAVVVNAVGGIYNQYAQNFNNCAPAFSKTLTGGWKQISLKGDATWACTAFGRPATGTTTNTNAVDINGYNSSTGMGAANEDWLISPSFDLTTVNVPVLSFWSKAAFAGPALRVMISTNYDGSSAPATATWTELSVVLPEVGSDVWTMSEALLDMYKQSSVHIAFVYTSVEEINGSARWTIDDFLITDEPRKLVASNATFDFGAIAAGNFTEAQYVTFKALGFTEDIVISSDLVDFEVSKDNITFSQSVTYTAVEAAEGEELFIRFLPKSTALRFNGTITATSGTDFEQVLGKVKGSSIPKSSTLDIVSWNVEWFGADRDPGDNSVLGPFDDALQYQNVKKAIQLLDADIYALQEVANDALMAQLVSELPGYSFVKSDVYSYSIRPSSFVSVPQKLYFVYKTSTVTVKKEKVLLKELYTDLLANTKQLEGYPGTGSVTANDDSFWASGRLPYMVEFEVNINGIKQNIHALNIHARANSGSNTTVVAQRRFDLQVLKDTLDAQYPNANLVMLGDYNDDVDMSVVGTNQPSTYDIFVNDSKYNVLTYDLSLITTEGTYNRSSFLDHITVSDDFETTYINESIQIEEGLFTAIPRFHTTTSDHAPISARFNLSVTPTVTFTEATATKAEGDAKYNVNLTLSAAQATEQNVTVSVLPSSTASAADYTVTGATNGMVTVTVPANATTASFELEISDDDLVEANEQVVFQMINKSANLVIGDANTYTLTITDNDKSTVNFAAAALKVNEESGLTEVTIELDQATVKAEQITVSVSNGLGVTYGATADYTTTPAVESGNIVINVPAGATSVKFGINVIDDQETEQDEVISFGLATVSNKLAIGTLEPVFNFTIERNDNTTGIANTTKGQFKVYPNPVVSYVNLELPVKATTGNISLSVWSVDGRRVFDTAGDFESAKRSLNSKINTFATGVYIIKVQAGKEVYQTRLMKK